MRQRWTVATLSFAITAALLPRATSAQDDLVPLSVIAFPGTGNWPIRIAQEKGYFAGNGIEVNLSPTPNSVFQITNLIEGKFDLAMTAADNVVAYVEGQGEVPVSTHPDLFMFMGGSPSIPVLVTVPEVKTFAELKGKTLAVDAITTGYAFVLFDLLKRNGLQPSEYRVEPVGGTQARWQGMRERKYAAAMLTSPFDLVAKADGFNVLQYAKDIYGHYEESIATTRRAWAAENEKKLLAYIKAYVAAVEWLREPGNRAEAIAILRKSFPQLSPEIAAGAYESFIGPRGMAAKAQLDIAGLRKVLELRSEYGRPQKTLTDPSRYYDLRYYDMALK
jgi:ABC-type nitrate/sulfonate/bicarbonate transport system substrate-binding protein